MKSRFLPVLIAIGSALTLLGPALAHVRLVSPFLGFRAFLAGAGLCALGTAIGAVLVLKGQRNLPILASTIVAGLIFVGLVFKASTFRHAPLINDVSTDLDTPPVLTGEAARTDLPEAMRRHDPGLRTIQEDAYPDLEGLRIEAPPEAVFARVRDAAAAQPSWTLELEDADDLRLEGVSETFLFRFRDHFAIEIRPTSQGSVVHMRSRSRDGKGDLGANARRIRRFFDVLRGS